MKSVRVVFRDGVFVPLEPLSIPEGTEGIVVYQEEKGGELPAWWNSLSLEENKKRALKVFAERLKKRVSYNDVKVVEKDGGFEVFVLVDDESSSLRPAMEEALRVYEEMGVYLPLQVISKRRLNRWREMENRIYSEIERGVSVG